MSEVGQPDRPAAVRLIFEYEGDQVRLVAQQRVDVAVPGLDLDVSPMPRPGHYVEARSATNVALSRVPIREGFSGSAEVFPEEPGGPITRMDVAEPRGAFTVVLPAPETAEQVAVVRVTQRQPEARLVPAGATSPIPGESEIVDIASFRLEAAG
jgi:hypothetical protein